MFGDARFRDTLAYLERTRPKPVMFPWPDPTNEEILRLRRDLSAEKARETEIRADERAKVFAELGLTPHTSLS